MALGGIILTMKLNEATNSKTLYLKPRLNLKGVHAEEMIDAADLVTEMVAVKHPLRKRDILSRRGIEF